MILMRNHLLKSQAATKNKKKAVINTNFKMNEKKKENKRLTSRKNKWIKFQFKNGMKSFTFLLLRHYILSKITTEYKIWIKSKSCANILIWIKFPLIWFHISILLRQNTLSYFEGRFINK